MDLTAENFANLDIDILFDKEVCGLITASEGEEVIKGISARIRQNVYI